MSKTQIPTLERVSKLRTELRVLVNDDLKPNNKNIYNSRINKFRDELDEIGISKELTLREAERSLEKWFELLSNPQTDQTPTPEYVTNTTLTPEQIENFNKDVERIKESERIRADQKKETERFKERNKKISEEQQKQRRVSTQTEISNTYEEIEREQVQIKADIQEAQNVQKDLENKKIYAKITIPSVPELTPEEKQDLQVLEEFAKDPKTRTQLIEDLTKEIETRITPTLEGIDKKTIEIIARTDAADIVEKIANPEARQRAQEENIQTAVYQSLGTNPRVVKEVIKETKPLQALEKGSLVLAYYSGQQNLNTQVIAGKLFDSKFKQIFYGPDYREIRVEYTDKPIQGQTNYIVDIGSVNREFIGIQQKQSVLLEQVKSLGIEKTQTFFSNQAGIYIQKTIDKLPAKSAIKQASSNPILKSFLSKYSLTEPVVWQAVGQSRIVGVLAKVAPEATAVVGKALGIELVKPVATKVAGQVATQVAIKKGFGAIITKAIAFMTGLPAGPAGLAISTVIGEAISRIGSKLKVWWTEHKKDSGPIIVTLITGGALVLGGPSAAGIGLGLSLFATGLLKNFVLGAIGIGGIIMRNVGITIATPVIVTLLILPPLVAFIMLVINNSAYVVPPSFLSNATIPPPPIGGLVSSCKENEDTGSDITEDLANRINGGVVKLLPETVWGRRDGICIKPTMIVMHWSAGTNDNPDGNQRTYETLVARNLSCQLATDTNDTWLMERFFEKMVEFPACAGSYNTYSINNEMAGVYFTANPPPPNLDELELTYDAICKVMDQYDIPWSQIRGHYQVPNSGKQDPGKDFLEQVFIPEIRKRCPNDRIDNVRNNESIDRTDDVRDAI